jgi:hypothetical protein
LGERCNVVATGFSGRRSKAPHGPGAGGGLTRLERIDESIARYLSQLETADRHGDAVPEAKVARLKGKIEKLKEEIVRLNAINVEMMKSEDKQISLTDPDARSMATSGKDTGIVGYNVQIAVDTQHHLIVAHEVTRALQSSVDIVRLGNT